MGGDEGDRTPDLLTASQALSQLSYAPMEKRSNGGDEGDRTPDLLTASQALSQLSYAPLQRENTIRELAMLCKGKFASF